MENERKIKRERTKEKRKEERGRERKIIMIFFSLHQEFIYRSQ